MTLKSTLNRRKIALKSGSGKISVFYNFLNRFSTILILAESRKTCKNLMFFKVFHFFNMFSPIRFFFQFLHHVLLNFHSQISPKPHKKNTKKTKRFLLRFSIDFLWIWDPIFEPSWPISAPSWPSKPLLKLLLALLRLLLALLGAILAPRCSPGAPQRLSDPPRPPF